MRRFGLSFIVIVTGQPFVQRIGVARTTPPLLGLGIVLPMFPRLLPLPITVVAQHRGREEVRVIRVHFSRRLSSLRRYRHHHHIPSIPRRPLFFGFVRSRV
jgi:hypothetical protein